MGAGDHRTHLLQVTFLAHCPDIGLNGGKHSRMPVGGNWSNCSISAAMAAPARSAQVVEQATAQPCLLNEETGSLLAVAALFEDKDKLTCGPKAAPRGRSAHAAQQRRKLTKLAATSAHTKTHTE